jgi:transposase
MWTDADRSTYRQVGTRLPSDLTDLEWDRLAPLIPPVKPGGRPRKTDMRSAMNAIFYLLRTGCPWRYLPPGSSRRARRSTTSSALPSGRACGKRSGRNCALRERLGREASPSAGVIDSQSLKSAEKGDARKVKQTQWVMTPARR